MENIIVISILAAWLIINIISKFAKKKKADYNLIVTFVFILAYGYFYYYEQFDSIYFTYYSYLTLGIFTLSLTIKSFKYSFKKEISEFDYYELQEELEELTKSHELLTKRFITTIELFADGICFKDAGEKFFGTDNFIRLFGIALNEFSEDDFERKIYKDDLPQYKSTIEKISKKTPTYTIAYRIKKDNGVLWIKEVGKRIYLDKKVSTISLVKPMDIKQFPQTEIEVLDSLPDHKKMYDEIQRLNRLKTPFNLVMIQLTNIPKINEKYGRDIGDLMMGEYLKKTRYNFIKDNQSLYRIGGINFGLIIKDEKKFEILKRALIGGGDLLNLNMIFGGVTQTVYPNLGITKSPETGKNTDQIIEEATEALRISLKEGSTQNYCFFQEN